jgi:hypothetical protein
MQPTLTGTDRFGRMAVALVAALTAALALLTVPVANPAHASACTAAKKEAKWYGAFSVQLMRDSTCRYYTRLTIDDPVYGAGSTINWKVERLELNSQGYFVTEVKSKSRLWNAGQWDTERVNGYVNSSPYLDWHHACWQFQGDSNWICTSWEEY